MAENALALAVNPFTFDASVPIMQAEQIKGAQTQNALGALSLQREGVTNHLQSQQAQLSDLDYQNALVKNAASRAMQSTDPSAAWDESMKAAADQGAGWAKQFVGRYSPVLAQSIAGLADNGGAQPASGAGGASGGATNQLSLDARYANIPPQEKAKSLSQLNMVMSELRGAHDGPSLAAAAQRLHDAGLPFADKFLGTANLDKYTAQGVILNLWNTLLPHQQYLQNSVATEDLGLPDPIVSHETKQLGDSLYSIASGGGSANLIARAPTKFEAKPDAFGQNQTFNPDTGAFSSGDANGGFGFDDFATRMEGAENGTGNPAAKNPLSSATGNGQFIDDTWLNTIKGARPDLAKGFTDNQLLALRADPAFSHEMTVENAKKNATALSANGHPVTSATLALAHRFGPQGADTILDAKTDTPLSDILSKKVIAANPGLEKQTVGQYMQDLTNRVGNDSIGSAGAGDGDKMHPGEMDKDTITNLAAQALAGDGGVLKGLGYGKAAAAQRAEIRNEMTKQMKEQGITPADLAERQASFGPAVKAFAVSQEGRTLRSANVLLSHLDTISDLGKALDSGDVQAVNRVNNLFKEQFGKDAPTNFDTARSIVGDEVVKAILGSGGGALGDRDEAKANIDKSKSWSQLVGVIETYKSLMAGQLGGLKQQYETTTGLKDFERRLSPAARDSFNKYGHASQPPAAPASLKGKTLQWNSQLQQFRDKATGKIYKMDGSPA